MKGISSNYQINFNGLVPKSQYSGKPKLEKWQIKQINRIKKYIKLIDDAMFKKEAEINNEISESSYLRQLKKELGALQAQRDSAVREIEDVKRGIPSSRYMFQATEKSIQESLTPVEDDFIRDYGTSCENYFDKLAKSVVKD